MKNKNLLLFIGFVLFLFGALSVIVGLVGVQLVPTAWMTDLFGGTAAFIIQLFMAMFGIAIAIVSRSDDDAFDEHFDGHKFRGKSNKPE